MNRYPAPELKDLPEDIRARILEVQEKAGFVPNVFLALARRPAEWRAFFAYHDALMLKDEGRNRLTKGDREMIVTTTSAANQCLYCVVAHGAILRIYEKKPLVADQVAVNYRKADITPRQRAMLDFAMKVCLRSHEIVDADFEALHPLGFTDEDIWDIAAITAFFGLSNRMASFSEHAAQPGVLPDGPGAEAEEVGGTRRVGTLCPPRSPDSRSARVPPSGPSAQPVRQRPGLLRLVVHPHRGRAARGIEQAGVVGALHRAPRSRSCCCRGRSRTSSPARRRGTRAAGRNCRRR